MALSVVESYVVARAALIAPFVIATFIIFLCALCLVPRRKDPVRACFLFLKIAFLFYFISLLFTFISAVLNVVYAILYYTYDELQRPESVCTSIFVLFNALSVALLLVTLVTLSVGIKIVLNGEQSKLDRIFKFIAYAMAGLITILSIAELGLRMKTYFSVNLQYQPLVNIDLWNAWRQLDFAITVFLFVMALAVTIRSILVMLQASNDKRVSTPSIYMLVCSLLMLLQTTFELADFAKFVNLSDVRNDPYYPVYMIVVETILGLWPTFVALCILFALGSKKRGGLWSTEQSYTGPPGSQSMNGYPYYQPQNGVPPMQHPQGYYNPSQQYYQHEMGNNQLYQLDGSHPDPRYQLDTNSVRSPPPPHDEAMGFNHQADGSAPEQLVHQSETKPQY